VDRVSRYLSGKKQDKIRVVNFQPSVQSMREGEEVLFFNKSGSLSRYRKEKGLLWRSDMSHNGSQSIDSNLQVGNKTTTGILEFKNKFIDYRMFSHNFSENLSTSARFLPWVGPTDSTGMDDARNSLLVPFDMTCHRILFRPETLTSDPTSANLTFTIVRQDDGDANVDTVATFQYETDNISNDTFLTVNESDFNNQPKVETGMKVGIKIQFDGDPASTIDYYITSVWRVEVEI
tara:strand:+ start:745 stop:1446 length:702 start_codon:yes stop_codon:yes gene_type:complete